MGLRASRLLGRRMVRRTVWRTVRQTHGPPALTTVTFWPSRSIVYNEHNHSYQHTMKGFDDGIIGIGHNNVHSTEKRILEDVHYTVII